MPGVCDESIAHVDHRGGAGVRSHGSGRVGRVRDPVRIDEYCGRAEPTGQHRQPSGGPAESACDREDVARLCPGAKNRTSPLEIAECRHSQRDDR